MEAEMTDSPQPEIGTIGWFDLTVPDTAHPIAGICHARGSNAGLPPTWLVYITVEDVDASAQTCRELGGEVVAAPRDMGEMGRFCVIQDPAGAIAALFAYR